MGGSAGRSEGGLVGEHRFRRRRGRLRIGPIRSKFRFAAGFSRAPGPRCELRNPTRTKVLLLNVSFKPVLSLVNPQLWRKSPERTPRRQFRAAAVHRSRAEALESYGFRLITSVGRVWATSGSLCR